MTLRLLIVLIALLLWPLMWLFRQLIGTSLDLVVGDTTGRRAQTRYLRRG